MENDHFGENSGGRCTQKKPRKNNYNPHNPHTSGPRPPPSLPPLKNLNVRSKNENNSAAEVFKQMMDDSDSVLNCPTSTTYERPLGNPMGRTHFEDMFADSYHVSRRRIRSLSHVSNGSTEDKEAKEQVPQWNHLLGPQPAAPSKAEVLYPTSYTFPPAEQEALTQSRQTTLFISEAGCDIPMIRNGSSRFPSISLDPELPPSAVQHPTRIWNVMLHSLPAELQPLIKWEYEEVELEHSHDIGWSAQLTLILPPSHPSVARHPLFHVLHCNRYSAEYIKGIETLGGVKTFKGPPRKLKTDAQNTTLLHLISEDALSWVYAPIMAPVPKLEDDSFEVVAQIEAVKPFPMLIKAGDSIEPIFQTSPNLTLLAEKIAQFDADSGVTLLAEFTICDATDLFGCKLTVGMSPNLKHYTEDCNHLESDAALTAVGRHAVEAGAVAFLDSLRGATFKGGSPELPATAVTEESEVQPTTQSVASSTGIDWQRQLNHFCSLSGLEPVKYTQRIEKRQHNSTIFFGIATVEDEKFEASVPSTNLKEARQEIARQVFVDHFGQEPVDL